MLQRYGNIPQMCAGDFVELACLALDKAAEDNARAEWLAVYPYMCIGYLKIVKWEDYKNRRLGLELDMRPADEIIAEIEALHGGV